MENKEFKRLVNEAQNLLNIDHSWSNMQARNRYIHLYHKKSAHDYSIMITLMNLLNNPSRRISE